MNLLDITLIVILAYCLIRGVFRGLVKELSSIIGVFGGFFAAYSYYLYAAEFLSRWINDVSYQNIIGFMALFCIVFILISLLGVLIKYLLHVLHMGQVDRVGGGVSGFAKGLIISSVLLIALTVFLPAGVPVIKESKISPYIIIVSNKMSSVVSKHIKERFTLNAGELKRAWKTVE